MPIDYPDIAPPAAHEKLRELRTPLQLLTLASRWHALPRKRVAAPMSVVLMPGFKAGPRSLLVMASYLRSLGHEVFDWGLGRNEGNVPKTLDEIHTRVDGWLADAGRPLVAVGWSLGGYLAREAARDRPDAFAKVITLASPVIGGPKFTSAARFYATLGYDVDEIEGLVRERYATPLTVPVTALYSKSDGIVAWEACIDKWSPDVEHIEVDGTHLGMGFSPEVLTILSGELRNLPADRT